MLFKILYIKLWSTCNVTNLLKNYCNACARSLWNEAKALHSPNGVLLYWYNPKFVIKAVFLTFSHYSNLMITFKQVKWSKPFISEKGIQITLYMRKGITIFDIAFIYFLLVYRRIFLLGLFTKTTELASWDYAMFFNTIIQHFLYTCFSISMSFV